MIQSRKCATEIFNHGFYHRVEHGCFFISSNGLDFTSPTAPSEPSPCMRRKLDALATFYLLWGTKLIFSKKKPKAWKTVCVNLGFFLCLRKDTVGARLTSAADSEQSDPNQD